EYYRIENDDFSVYLSNICAGGSRTEAAGNGNKDRLTLDDVTALSQKGEALSWADFERFYYVETGSGLYIRVYEIDSLFSLWIGGAGLDIEPMYISLRTGTEPEYAVDIRWEDVKDFIGRHRNLRVYRSVSDNSDDSEFCKRAEVVLYDDGTFTFTFSPVSSYLGYGTYETDDERLILNTDDGQYTYVFDMTDDTLVFNAAASAYQLWQYGITDGSVLKMY
ncbi:MAG: hypothetical protein PHZ09_03600, partial [Eubacteriales bacterium]|nr:hypothetical protein [Eubacteriales bacterium]